MVLPTAHSATTIATPAPQQPANASQANTSAPQQTQSSSETAKHITSNITSDLSAMLLPVQVQQKQTSVNTQINVAIQEQQYLLNKTAELQKLLQQTSQIVISNEQAKSVARAAMTQVAIPADVAQLATQTMASAKPIPAQLILLAQTVQFALPQSLTELAAQNGVSTKQLMTLASRPQGYPLPTAHISQGQLTFTDGPTVQLPNSTVLNNGQYLAKVVLNQHQLQLALTPVIGEIKVDLLKQSSTPQSVQHNNIVVTKNEPVQILSQFLKKLEASPLPSTNTVNETTQLKTPSGQISAAVNSTQLAEKSPAERTQMVSQQTVNSTKSQDIAGLNTQNTAQSPQTKNNDTLANIQAQGKQTEVKTNPLNLNQGTTKSGSNANIQQLTQNPTLPQTKQETALGAKPLNTTPNQDPQPIEVLNKALSKAGAMPIKQQHSLQVSNNLATELLKQLPQINPQPLSALSDPKLLSNELYSLAGLNLAQTQLSANNAVATTLYSGGAITTLFQLLLGVKAKTTGTGISAKLQEHLNQLQQRTLAKLSANSGLLSALDKLGGADSLAQLAGSIALYQQASTDPSQAMTWYFALPYSLNQRNEQFEGKFEQENEQDNDKSSGWKLQLKFNMTQGSLLICAHKKAEKLDIQFKGNNQALLAKVDQYNGALADKISQIGLSPGTFSTQLTPIPATLLPGDHYLVKTRA
ncbi:hypothetical protein L2703_04890 [Shewanella basaltis]|uniref:hypothetical protein n=1 Tax=Shewanella basaltis TaxID=472183 RepID=UPI00200D5D63|nr:hypothetical protein [Shewanella basaltis]MCL1112933.1 hypothetical protein [Shewanella basaltis]